MFADNLLDILRAALQTRVEKVDAALFFRGKVQTAHACKNCENFSNALAPKSKQMELIYNEPTAFIEAAEKPELELRCFALLRKGLFGESLSKKF